MLDSETQVMVGKKEIQMTLRFVDAMIYTPSCTLDQFTQDYTEKKRVERVKGFFPYEAITTDNYKNIGVKQKLLNKMISIHH
jgi:predicted nucleic acid-binding protein